jgi:hypothetical protein
VTPVLWRRNKTEGFFAEAWTPDLQAERDERLGWAMRKNVPWKLFMGQLVLGRRYRPDVQRLLHEAKLIGSAEWGSRMRALRLAGEHMAAEGTYGALGAYPLEAELAAFTPTAATEGALLTSAANQALYMPIPARSILGPQAYRFIISGRVTTSATAGNVSFPVRLGFSNAGVSLGTPNPQAKVISITNAMFIVKGDVTVLPGLPGTNAKAIGHFQSFLNNTTTIGGTYLGWAWGSTAAASFDSTVAPNTSANGGQIWVGVLESAGASPWTVGQVHYMDWN